MTMEDFPYGEPRVSYWHEHYCEEKLFCGSKKKFNCHKKVKYKNASHDDKCDFCNRMITVYFQDDLDYHKTLKVYRMNT